MILTVLGKLIGVWCEAVEESAQLVRLAFDPSAADDEEPEKGSLADAVSNIEVEPDEDVYGPEAIGFRGPRQ